MTALAESRDEGISIELTTESGDWPDVTTILQRAAETAWAMAGDGALAEVAVSLTDDEEIRQLNRDFRNKDKPTDVLSFPAGDAVLPGNDAFLGDIALALSFIRREAELENKVFEDHLVHLLVHGLLHLTGHDHEDPAEAAEMERLEKDILADLGISDPYAGRELDSERP